MKQFRFNELVEAFRGFFANTHDGSDFRQGENWCYAVVKNANNDSIHYEIIRRGAHYFIELHVECKVSKFLLDKLKVTFDMHSAGDVIEIGLRKAPDKESTTDKFYNELKATCPSGSCMKLPDGFVQLEKPGEKFWYLYKDISSLFGKEDISQYVAKELLNIWAWVNTKGGNDVV